MKRTFLVRLWCVSFRKQSRRWATLPVQRLLLEVQLLSVKCAAAISSPAASEYLATDLLTRERTYCLDVYLAGLVVFVRAERPTVLGERTYA